MAYEAWAQFVKAGGNRDLEEKGQPDGRSSNNNDKAHPKDKWFEVLSWEWDAMAPVNHANGQLAGGAVTGVLRLVKYWNDPLSGHIFNACHAGRLVDEFRLDIMDQAPPGGSDKIEDQKPYTWATLIVTGAVITGLSIGNGKLLVPGDKADNVNDKRANDNELFVSLQPEDRNQELEMIELTFQGYKFEYCGSRDKALKDKDKKVASQVEDFKKR